LERVPGVQAFGDGWEFAMRQRVVRHLAIRQELQREIALLKSHAIGGVGCEHAPKESSPDGDEKNGRGSATEERGTEGHEGECTE
jgi:hypothetical protein